MSDPEIRSNGKAASELSKKVAASMLREDSKKIRMYAETDEHSIVRDASNFLKDEMGLPVSVFSADDPSKYDPMGKSAAAIPGRPAIYLE